MKILVTGGSGMVGRFYKEIEPNAIFLSSKDCDLTDIKQVTETWEKHMPDVVIHLAARVGGIIDNINHPAEYYEENVLINTNVLMASRKIGVKRLIAILSTCIYPDSVLLYPMPEYLLHEGPPTKTNFSYGYAKRSLAVHIDAYNHEYGTKYQYLIPCNLYGEYDKYGENSHFVAALIKKIYKAKENNESELNLFGTGKPLRQFMYGADLAYVIKYCLDNEIYDNMNVATEENYTIKEIAEIAIDIIGEGKITDIKFDITKPDGQYRKDVSIDNLKRLIPDFKPTTLSEGITKTIKNLNFTNL